MPSVSKITDKTGRPINIAMISAVMVKRTMLSSHQKNSQGEFVSLKDKEKWDSKYSSSEYVSGKLPCAWLTMNAELLAGKGNALDIAMGEGRNAVYLATLGYEVMGIDISDYGVKKALALADEKKVKIETVVADLEQFQFQPGRFNVILCFNFLDRRLFPEIRKAIKPGGLLFFETFTVDYLKYSNFKKEWVLEHNELLREFGDFRILRYQEMDNNEKAFASLVAQKPEAV